MSFSFGGACNPIASRTPFRQGDFGRGGARSYCHSRRRRYILAKVVKSVVPVPESLSAVEDLAVREKLQTDIDIAWGRIKPLIRADEQDREHARLVFNAVWLATRAKIEGDFVERLIARFFQP